MSVVSSDSLAKGRLVGDRQARACTGDIVLAPPEVPHKFTNQGPGNARLICVHASPTIATEFLE
jgi:mannose-6-phosphate isomerase-like protein (cupin superfamily)